MKYRYLLFLLVCQLTVLESNYGHKDKQLQQFLKKNNEIFKDSCMNISQYDVLVREAFQGFLKEEPLFDDVNAWMPPNNLNVRYNKKVIPGYSRQFSVNELIPLFSQLNTIIDHSTDIDANFSKLKNLLDKLCISCRRVLYQNVTSDARNDGKIQFSSIAYKLLAFPAHLGSSIIPTTPKNIRQKIIVAYSALTRIYDHILT